MTLIGITVRSWLYEGSCALENIVLGMEERAVRDGGNHLSTDEFDACLAIVVCRIGSNTFAHLGQIVGLYRGDARQIWDRSKDCGPPEGETYEMKPLTRITACLMRCAERSKTMECMRTTGLPWSTTCWIWAKR